MKSNVALICVDVQNDFMPGGSLPVEDGDMIIPVVNQMLPVFDFVIFTKDWHPSKHVSFASQHEGKKPFDQLNGDTLWPDHCVKKTYGAELHHGIHYDMIKGDFYIFKKGTKKKLDAYSGFSKTGLSKFLKKKGIDTVYICGLATDVCCMHTAKDAVKKGFETYFVIDAMRGIAEDLSETYSKLSKLGVHLVNSTDILG